MLAKSSKINLKEITPEGWKLYQFEIKTTFDLEDKIVFGTNITQDIYDKIVKDFKIHLAEKMNFVSEEHLISTGITPDEITWKIKK